MNAREMAKTRKGGVTNRTNSLRGETHLRAICQIVDFKNDPFKRIA
jgi:hypothetical protein